MNKLDFQCNQFLLKQHNKKKLISDARELISLEEQNFLNPCYALQIIGIETVLNYQHSFLTLLPLILSFMHQNFSYLRWALASIVVFKTTWHQACCLCFFVEKVCSRKGQILTFNPKF
jgi:hypothetical protein